MGSPYDVCVSRACGFLVVGPKRSAALCAVEPTYVAKHALGPTAVLKTSYTGGNASQKIIGQRVMALF